jgi:hypothetical protein
MHLACVLSVGCERPAIIVRRKTRWAKMSQNSKIGPLVAIPRVVSAAYIFRPSTHVDDLTSNFLCRCRMDLGKQGRIPPFTKVSLMTPWKESAPLARRLAEMKNHFLILIPSHPWGAMHAPAASGPSLL